MWTVLLLASAGWASFDDQALFAVFGSLVSLFATLPLSHPRYSLISTWTPLSLAISLSSGLRGWVQALGLEGRFTIERLWTLGHSPSYYLGPSLIYALGIAVAAASYVHCLSKSSGTIRQSETKAIYYTFNRWAPAIALFCSGVGFATFIAYTQRTGGVSLESISQKRTTINGLDLDSSYQSHGQLRYFNGLSAMGFWVMYARHRLEARQDRTGSALWRGAVLCLLLLNSVALPFYASSRSDVAHVLLVTVAIRALVGRGGVKISSLVSVLLAVYLAMAAMTYLRANQQAAGPPSLDTLLTTSTEGIIYDRNFGDLLTSGNIIGSVPEKLEYQNGATIFMWIIAPVPRALWTSKPIITPGPTIGNIVYGTQRSGVPPGYMAEMYWNFSLAGIIVGGLLLGLSLNRIDRRFPEMDLIRSPLLAVLYSVVFFRFGMFAISGGIGSALFRSTTELAMTAAVLFVCRQRMAAAVT